MATTAEIVSDRPQGGGVRRIVERFTRDNGNVFTRRYRGNPADALADANSRIATIDAEDDEREGAKQTRRQFRRAENKVTDYMLAQSNAFLRNTVGMTPAEVQAYRELAEENKGNG